MRKICVAALIAISFTSGSAAQSGSIWINGVELRAGMPKADALTALGRRNALRKVSDDIDEWGVFSKADATEPLAFVTFRSDRLTYVDKSSGAPISPEVADVLGQFFSLLNGSTREHDFFARISTTEVTASEPGGGKVLGRFITVFLPPYSGGKSVMLQIGEPIARDVHEAAMVGITEMLRTAPEPVPGAHVQVKDH